MSSKTKSADKLLFTSADWDFETLKATYDAIEDIALNELKLDVYPNQVEVITSEQMLDAYSSIGMPLMYHHWSFGKRFVRDDVMYRKGYQWLPTRSPSPAKSPIAWCSWTAAASSNRASPPSCCPTRGSRVHATSSSACSSPPKPTIDRVLVGCREVGG